MEWTSWSVAANKIEEAQKELKDPTSSTKGISESSRRLEGLKRKKLVGENKQKKIPKSPVKKPLQLKTPETVQGGTPKETTTSSLTSKTPSRKPSSLLSEKTETQDAEVLQPSPDKGESVTDHERLKPEETKPPSHKPTNDEDASLKVAQSKDSSFDKDPYHTSAPLDVLLKAMEPDMLTLAEKKNTFLVADSTKPTKGEISNMPAVNISLHPQSSPMQTYYIDKQGNFIGIAPPLQESRHTSTQRDHLQSLSFGNQRFIPVVSNPEKPSLHMSFNSGLSTITHAPAPSGSNALPKSQPPIVHTCQSLSASVPSSIQVPVTPGNNHVQITTVMNFGADQVSKDQKPKKPGKYVCEYCNRACAKPSVLLKHIRSHTGERPYPCVTCGFSFKTKSNLYKHKKSHAHAIKLGLIARSESGGGTLSQDSDKVPGTHSEVEESGDSDDEGSTVDLDPDSSQSSAAALSETSSQNATTTQANYGEIDSMAVFDAIKPALVQRSHEPKAAALLPKVVVYPANVSPLRADSPQVTCAAPEQAASQRQREFPTVNLRSNVTVLSSLKEVVGTSPSLDTVSEDEDQQCKSPLLSGHGQLQRQQATDFSQQQQAKCLLSPRSLGSTDSGYFSRSESADQAMSPPSPFVKITPPTEIDLSKKDHPTVPPAVSTVMHLAMEQRSQATEGQMRPPLETKALSLEERISKLISDNEAVVDNKQLDSVKPRRTSLSRRGSIDSPKSYIFKDSFQFDLKPIGRRSSSSSDIPKSPFTPTDKSKPVFLLSVPSQYPPMDCLPITRSNSMPTTPGHSAFPLNIAQLPHPLRICHSFDEKTSVNDDVFSSAPSTPNTVLHSRTLVRQAAVEDFSSNEGHRLPTVRSMDDAYHGVNNSSEHMQRSRSFEHSQERQRKLQQNKGTMYECETCRNRYRKLENFETHKKFYCSELHGPKNKPVVVKETDQDVFHVQPNLVSRSTSGPGLIEQQTSFRKRRKMKSVGDEDDQSPTDTNAPCSVSFDSAQLLTTLGNPIFPQHAVMVDVQPKNNQPKLTQIQLVARGTSSSDSRLSPIRETQIGASAKGEIQRQGSGTSVIRHTNSLSRPSSFETESTERSSPLDSREQEPQKSKADVTAAEAYHETLSNKIIEANYRNQRMEQCTDAAATATGESATPAQQCRLVRQNNIQVPEILVTEEPDRDHETQPSEQTEKHTDQFNWPQRSETLSKLPAEKLPPKKKRIRLAQMEHSSGESSFESSLSRSLSRDSTLSHCSSISASFDREEPSRSESPSGGECVSRIPEPQGQPKVFSTLGVPGAMRRAASEQITCTQPSVEISCDYRSKSFDCGNVSPRRGQSPVGHPTTGPITQGAQVPLIERRRGPLVRQMSLKICPDNQQSVRKAVINLDKAPIVNMNSLNQNRSQIVNRFPMVNPFILHSGEIPLPRNEQTVQSIHLGSPTQQPQVYGLPHPWHQTSRVQVSQKVPQPASQILVGSEITASEDSKCLVPKYQLRCPTQRPSETFPFHAAQESAMTLPVLTMPVANPVLSISKSSEVLQNESNNQTRTGVIPLPQILITHDQIQGKGTYPTTHIAHPETPLVVKKDWTTTGSHNTGERAASLGSLHCTQKLASVTLCPQQEPIASSKRMLSPANSLDIYMEKHQKRAKDENGVACLTDGRSVSYLNSTLSEVTRQRKLTLVRQVCTTEPADSPIETEAPPLPHVQTETEKDLDDVKPMSPDSTGLEKRHEVIPEEKTTSPDRQSSQSLKPQVKVEEHRWNPVKSPIKPSSFHHAKLPVSVSVVGTKESHRLSFPSLKTTTTFTWCFLTRRKSLHALQSDLKTSAYAAWTVNPDNPNPLGLPTKVVMSLLDSKQSSKKILYTSAIKTSRKSDILSYSGKLKDVMPRVPVTQKTRSVEARSKAQIETHSSNESDKELASKIEPRRIKIFDGGYKSNEEYVYVRGRGRGKYICEECGIRCKKPSMLRKHIRTHSDVRPYHCIHCNFSFKTKGNLTKHMKSKAHSKKCMEMGVPNGLSEDQDAEDSGDRSQVSSADRQDSDGDDSEGPDEEENDDEEEEDSQAESGLSTNPSVSASPQHIPSKEAEVPPSALLAQMSISSFKADAAESALGTEALSLSRQYATIGYRPSSTPPVAADSNFSDTESVHMMSPVSPCRQMSIDYPDCEGPFSPPGTGFRPQQEASPAKIESSTPVDRSTQTSSTQSPTHASLQAPRTETRLFSHLPLHSQQPFRSPYNMIPVGGIQLVPAGLAAYSTFVPIQAGPVQLTIPAVSVIQRNASPDPSDSYARPLVIQEPVANMVACFPLGQGKTVDTLNLMGQMLPQQGVALQVLAASPTSQSSTGTQTHVPNLQIVNIALPAIIPSLSPLPRSPDSLRQPSRTGSPLACADAPRPVLASPELTASDAAELTQTLEKVEGEKSNTSPEKTTAVPKGDAPKTVPPASSWQTILNDYNEVSSDDEDRLIIAT
ncbi:zinc finger protein 40 isoform X2 [Corythoichthys intestinalis]|uniref:zinc finger protein 40 isoform X2 n=1 Tax=Corythoichthys intestinalis TaxID=161448 RepID=UPI0025A55D57|nr:zinc finger protein 40 isoform X2 [Corythoichthys intestinalis]